ncbi:hypothetical protein [Ramlibacter pallidus]|uniref:Tetratricopeptide repeat protein n=1 Tax=Ramlibacter pallidus TaxID=2780087 RepID=A0ABR9S5D6_9BURK|nr:hypothetical protein [Ramlibacter pallidus]MBE7368688.1 hypothetical protein [Ramlibacter pallidus]
MRHLLLALAVFGFPLTGQAQASCEEAFDATRQGKASAMQLLGDCLSSSAAPTEVRGQAFEYRAWLHAEAANFKEAALDQERSFSLLPRLTYRSLINHSLYLRHALRREESLIFARIAEAVESASGEGTSMKTQYHLGWSLLELERHAEAVSAFTRGIPYQPDYSAVYWLRAQAYERMGNAESAKADLVTLSTLLRTSKGREDLGKWREAAAEKLRVYGVSAR